MEKLKLFLIKACLFVWGFLVFENFINGKMEERFGEPEKDFLTIVKEMKDVFLNSPSIITEAKQNNYYSNNLVTKAETIPYSPTKESSSMAYGGFPNTMSNSKNIGSAKNAKHKLYVLTIFVTQDKDPLTPEEKRDYEISLWEAKDWLVDIAAEYGKEFDLGLYNVGYDNGSEFHIADSYDIDKLTPEYIAKMYYGHNYFDRIRGYAKEKGYDNFIFIVCCKNDSEICRAYKDCEGLNHSQGYLEGCIVNMKTKSDLTTVIAHEILHTLGAWDLYVSDEKNYNIYRGDGARYSKMTEGSIMRNTHRPINNTKMDALTAYLVGLSDTRYDWFDILSENGGY